MKLSTPYECVPLQKVVYFQEGPGLRNWQYGNNGIPFLNIRTITNEGYINKSLCQFVKQEEFQNKYEHFLLDAGDYVVSSSGTLGKLAEVRDGDLPLMLNTSVIRFRPLDETELDRTYLKWFIKSPLYIRQIERASTGTAIKNYGPSHLKKMVIPLPPLEEQKRIAAILDKADAIRRKRSRAIALTEELLRSTFLDMFGDPVTNPKGWKVESLENISTIQSGIAKGKKVNPSEAISVPYIRVANVQDGYLNLDEIKELQVLSKDVNRYLLQNGDLLLTEGGDPDKLGRGAIWYSHVDPCLHQNHIFAVRPQKDIAEPEYLSALIGSE